MTPKKDETWLILPLLAFSKYDYGKKELVIGWLNKFYLIEW